MDMRLPSVAAAARQGPQEPPPPLRLLQRWQPPASRALAAPASDRALQRLLLRLLGR